MPVGTECEIYGGLYGCRPECEVFIRGECEMQESNAELFNLKGNDNDKEKL